MKITKIAICTIFFSIFLSIVFSGITWAGSEPLTIMEEDNHPLDPNREEVIRLEQLSIAINHGLEDEFMIEAAGNGPLTIAKVQEPSLDTVGKWTISYDQSYGAPNICRIFLLSKDWSDDFTATQYFEWENGYVPESYTSCPIVSAGEYQIDVWVQTITSGEKWYYATDKFVLEDDSAHTSLSEKVKSVVAECTAESKWQTALNLHDWLILNAYYDFNYEFYGADGVLLRGKGVCDSYSKAYIMLCREAGIPVSKVEGGNHAWNAIEIDEKWYYVDPTWDDHESPDAPFYTYFCLNEELMSIDHSNDGNYFSGVCDSLDANYYIHTGKWAQWGGEYYWENDRNYARPFCEKLAKAIDDGQPSCSITEEAIWRNKPDGSGIEGKWVNKRNMGIISYGLQNIKLPLSGGGTVVFTSTYSSTGLTASLSGWAEPSTGVLTLPQDLKTISDRAFTDTSADTLIIPAGARIISSQAFANSSIRTVYAPDGVEIAADSFQDCNRILFVTTDENIMAYARENHCLVANP